ncbi:Eco47II family restriction endonuclease [Prevotella sp. OH937_COT-195]|uniref:Eco47II family restriction endonuclease n=1 Tax=Prevotella sp. OH937_COT-195 TaxID=2491051 RepID=UPI000F64A054|nr:Eco47II family restriction endonuclease [Prevotella sp. OH937_COT-195]RRC99455.1 Eco47II family restriction endonuclease [Prevotella sp. OH937_COT-195]
MRNYNLGFMSDKDIYEHVKNTVLQYRKSINLKEFNKNIIDPIKLTFDSKIYGYSIAQAIEAECIRQIDKSNNNKIGYFHQYLFKYAGGGWEVPDNGEEGGFDVMNEEKCIYAELKNKHNTMNSASATATYLKMLDRIMRSGNRATCYLVETIARRSQDVVWETTVIQNGHRERYNWPGIHRISMDKFYEIVFGDKYAFFKLCKNLPDILDDVVMEDNSARLSISVYDELDAPDFYKGLYMLAFNTYEGFERF